MTIHRRRKPSSKHITVEDQSSRYVFQNHPDSYQDRPYPASYVGFGQSAASPGIFHQDWSIALDSHTTWSRAISDTQWQSGSDWSDDRSNRAWSLAPASQYINENMRLAVSHLHSDMALMQETSFNQCSAQTFGLGHQFPGNFDQISPHGYAPEPEPQFTQTPDWTEGLFSHEIDNSAAPPIIIPFLPWDTEQLLQNNLTIDALTKEAVSRGSTDDSLKPDVRQYSVFGESAHDPVWVMVTNETFQDPAIRRVRSRKQSEKNHRHLIKMMGGACDKCKRDKRKVILVRIC